ncbi:uncharacterized protein LOC133909330 isoform X2 [Phragmites australis]|uniref:uncharacterized protein LOC133909330 isoform X2 n=1 Tax=Phragmites australis TaxID=29695 RepID=UPI002D794D95|nr:uncharacterized protein LOC133909330 isoform X2 [Phragmites australis]XP_062207697.1 uncharacterized protein LOC133909330 isoform X2 [Phragmites australis]XP_062207698.1 uncharacterized protein LOC133909330 isoform X2 [Phragmites australis]
MAETDSALTGALQAPVAEEETGSPPDRKRKLGEMEGEDVNADKEAEEGGARGDGDPVEVEGTGEGEEAVEREAKRARVDGEADASGSTQNEVSVPETSEAVNGEASVDGNMQPSSAVNVPKECSEYPQEDGAPSSEQQDASAATQEMISRRIEISHSEVGGIIGKGGNIIKSLEATSGAKIEIIQDTEADQILLLGLSLKLLAVLKASTRLSSWLKISWKRLMWVM